MMPRGPSSYYKWCGVWIRLSEFYVFVTGYVTQIVITTYYDVFRKQSRPIAYIYLREELPDGYIHVLKLLFTYGIYKDFTISQMQNATIVYHWRGAMLSLLRDALIHQIPVLLKIGYISASIHDVGISKDPEGVISW